MLTFSRAPILIISLTVVLLSLANWQYMNFILSRVRLVGNYLSIPTTITRAFTTSMVCFSGPVDQFR